MLRALVGGLRAPPRFQAPVANPPQPAAAKPPARTLGWGSAAPMDSFTPAQPRQGPELTGGNPVKAFSSPQAGLSGEASAEGSQGFRGGKVSFSASARQTQDSSTVTENG